MAVGQIAALDTNVKQNSTARHVLRESIFFMVFSFL